MGLVVHFIDPRASRSGIRIFGDSDGDAGWGAALSRHAAFRGP
jgi:hypothetical protein